MKPVIALALLVALTQPAVAFDSAGYFVSQYGDGFEFIGEDSGFILNAPIDLVECPQQETSWQDLRDYLEDDGAVRLQHEYCADEHILVCFHHDETAAITEAEFCIVAHYILLDME